MICPTCGRHNTPPLHPANCPPLTAAPNNFPATVIFSSSVISATAGVLPTQRVINPLVQINILAAPHPLAAQRGVFATQQLVGGANGLFVGTYAG
jgi:hypothetical protein